MKSKFIKVYEPGGYGYINIDTITHISVSYQLREDVKIFVSSKPEPSEVTFKFFTEDILPLLNISGNYNEIKTQNDIEDAEDRIKYGI